MMLNHNNISKMNFIERYFNDDLSKEELEFFNEQLIKDTDFAKEVRQFDVIFKVLNKARSEKLRSQFLSYETQYNSKNNTSQLIQFKRKVATFAALSFVLLAAAYFCFFSNTPNNHQLLYAQYFEVYPNVIAPVTRSTNQNLDEVYQAMSQYDSMHYKEAINAFNGILQYSELQNDLLFYKGLALMSNDDFVSAKVQFELMNSESGSFINQRKWYLALVFLQLDEFKQTERLLKEIIRDKSSFSATADRLLHELSS